MEPPGQVGEEKRAAFTSDSQADHWRAEGSIVVDETATTLAARVLPQQTGTVDEDTKDYRSGYGPK